MSLKNKVLLLIILLLVIPFVLSLFNYYSIRRHLINLEVELLRSKSETLINRFNGKIEEYKRRIASSVAQYSALNFKKEEIIWRITGELEGVVEGAYYSSNGMLLKAVSRERVKPRFPKYIPLREITSSTDYGGVLLRILIEDREEGVLKGYYLFSLDITRIFQELFLKIFPPGTDVALAQKGNIYAFTNPKLLDKLKAKKPFILEGEKLKVLSDFGVRKIYVERPLSEILKPAEPLRDKILLSGFLTVSLAGSLSLILLMRIFKPLEEFKDFLMRYERKNYKDDVKLITETFKDLIKKIEEQRSIYNRLFESTLDGVILFNEKGAIIDVNETLCKMFGTRKGELLGKKMEDISKRKLEFKRFYLSDETLRIKNNHTCEVMQEILNIEGKPYVVWRVRDKTKEKELKVMLDYTSKLALTGEVACFVAHQINNSLASIRGYAELLGMLSRDNGMKEKVREIISQVDKCAETTRFLLELGKPLKEKARYVSPIDITIDVLKVLKPKASKKGLKIEVRESLNGEKVYTFPWQMEQVLINILDNAIDASPPGERVYVNLYKDRGNIVWEVEDRGEGIKDVDKAFKPFYTTKEGGTGLGLPIAKRLVEELGGRITVRKEKGTVVRICLPEVAGYEGSCS
ncbi:ATP-binding protein [Aquifex pyrophilus]